MIYVVYQHTRDVDGYSFKIPYMTFCEEHEANICADELEFMSLYRDSWFTVEEEE
jgi:hypothetical protein